MKEIFTYLCNFSIVTSLAILLAVLLRPVLKKGPSFIRCILWALVFLRLLVPVGLVEVPLAVPSFPTNAEETVSTPNGDANPAEGIVPGNNAVQSPGQAPAEQPSAVQTPDVQSPAVQDPNLQTPDVQPPAVQEPNVQVPDAQAPANDSNPGNSGVATAPVTDQTVPQPETGVDVLFVLSVVWAVGVVAMLGYMLASNLMLRYRVRGAIVYDSRIRVIDRDCSPFVFGIFRPIIYIPASVSKTDWPHIIAHETSHIKRFDHVLKPLAFFVLCFYWFNPLVWAAYILFGKDIEYACDERTVKSMEGNDRKAYSLALLAVSQGENIVFAPPLSFGKVSVKERIKRVMNRKIPVWAMCVTLILCASLLVLAALSPASVDNMSTDSDESSPTESETSEDGNEPFIELELSVTYADPAELEDDSLFYDEQGEELVKIRVNKEVKEFKFIKILYDDNTDPYAGDALFEVEALTPDTPFYAQTYINEGLSDRGISFVDDDGQTVSYRIMYASYGVNGPDESLYLERIAGEPSDPTVYPPTYDEVLALHQQAPGIYRDPGELQPETKEMIQLEDGQWYQSFVASSYNCRFIFLSNEEYEMPALWDFIAIGSAENAFLFNAGAVYDDPSWGMPYVERPIAVRGTLSEGSDGYAYQLQLPDELIVCVEIPANARNGTCGIMETETLAIPQSYASLFEGKTGEVIVAGVVMQDENGVFYLKDVMLYYRFVSWHEPSEPTEQLALPDFSTMALTEFFPEGNKYFDLGANTFWVIDSYVRGNFDRIKTRYALDGNVALPAQAPRNTIADYRDYCITHLSAEPYVLDGKQVEKVTVVSSLLCTKKGQEGYLEFRLEFVNAPGAFDWKLLRLDVQNGSKPQGDDSIPLTDPMTVQDFLASSKCQALQAAAFNFINAYHGGDYEEARGMFFAPSWALERPESWDSRSRDDYTGYGISWVKFETYELDGKQVQGARYFLSMYCAVPGEEGVFDPLMTFVYVDGEWKLLDLDFDA